MRHVIRHLTWTFFLLAAFGQSSALAQSQTQEPAGVVRRLSVDDAVKLAETARDAAKAIGAGSGDKAANLQKIQGTCGACHRVHREGSAPDFTIK